MALGSRTSNVKAWSLGSKIVFVTILFIYSYMIFRTWPIITQELSRYNRLHLNPLPDVITQQKYYDLDSFTASCDQRELQIVIESRYSKVNALGHLERTDKRTSCPRDLREANSSFPRTWLLSFPGSGNTWLRHLMQQLTGLTTGSVYKDTILKKNGFPYENRKDHVIAIKIHSLNQITTRTKFKPHASKRDRLILLIRNPYWSLFAEFKFKILNLGHTGNAFVDNKDERWSKFIEEKLLNWRSVLLEGLETKREKIIIFYEDLKSQILVELIRLAAFLKTNSLKEFAFCCTLYHSEGKHHRPPSNQTLNDVYTRKQKRLINSVLSELATNIQSDNAEVARRIASYILTD